MDFTILIPIEVFIIPLALVVVCFLFVKEYLKVLWEEIRDSFKR